MRQALLVLLWLVFNVPTHPVVAQQAYTDSRYQTDIVWGVHSEWVQPWRGYLETVPATRWLNGVGVVLNSPNPDLVCEMLAKHNVKITRIEIGWGNVSYIDGQIHNQKLLDALAACAKWHIRPILLLDSYQGVPCPFKGFFAHAATAAPAGATTLTFTDTTGFVVGKTGISNMHGYIAAQDLVTSLNGNTATLSQPLFNPIAAGQTLNMATLLVRPFSVPGSQDYLDSLKAWDAYVLYVGQLAASYFGAGGFDLEVWNELTFGSNFLYIGDYYNPNPYDSQYNRFSIWPTLVQHVCDVVTANPAVFGNCEVGDGFGNTLPWPASSTEPARVTAISHHSYTHGGSIGSLPWRGISLNALLQQENPPQFEPSYSLYFIEWALTANQTETSIRDLSPITTPVPNIYPWYGTNHGRYARGLNSPVWGWVTECGYQPKSAGVLDIPTALLLKAKSSSRYLCSFLNKGCTKLCLFGSSGGDDLLGIVQDNFLSYAATNTVYPTNDAPYTSPALLTIQRIAHQMAAYAVALKTVRQLSVVSVTDTHNHFQFSGDGTLAHPNLYDRDVLGIFPYQSAPNRFVIPFYVMTRNLVPTLTPEPFTIAIQGLNAVTTRIACYDPINNRGLPVTINSAAGDTVTFTVNAADYPYLLVVTD